MGTSSRKIPDRIKELEHYINAKQHHLNNEEDFEISCKLNSEIADLASIINDLWLWYRLTQMYLRGKHTNKKHAPQLLWVMLFCRNIDLQYISCAVFAKHTSNGPTNILLLSATLQKQQALLHIESFLT